MLITSPIKPVTRHADKSYLNLGKCTLFPGYKLKVLLGEKHKTCEEHV